jgi:hypothetical protein
MPNTQRGGEADGVRDTVLEPLLWRRSSHLTP